MMNANTDMSTQKIMLAGQKSLVGLIPICQTLGLPSRLSAYMTTLKPLQIQLMPIENTIKEIKGLSHLGRSVAHQIGLFELAVTV